MKNTHTARTRSQRGEGEGMEKEEGKKETLSGHGCLLFFAVGGPRHRGARPADHAPHLI